MCADVVKEYDAKIEELGKQVSGLTLIEAAELAEYLEDKLGVSAAMMAGASAAPAAAGEEDGDQSSGAKTHFDIVGKSFDAAKKIQAIKQLRAMDSNLGLAEANALCKEIAGKVLREAVPKEEAEEIMKKFDEAGLKVTLE